MKYTQGYIFVFNDAQYVQIHKFGAILLLDLVLEETVKPSTKSQPHFVRNLPHAGTKVQTCCKYSQS